MAVAGSVVVSLELLAETAMIQVFGRLDGAALQPCRAALASASESREAIVVDVHGVTLVAEAGLPLLGAMRRYAQARRATLRLTGISRPLLHRLQREGLGDLYGLASIEHPAGVGRGAAGSPAGGGDSRA